MPRGPAAATVRATRRATVRFALNEVAGRRPGQFSDSLSDLSPLTVPADMRDRPR